MVRNGDVVEAHQWNSATLTWTKVGEVVDAVGSSRKQVYQGQEYDYVFDIDIGAGPGGMLKLPYNVTGTFNVHLNATVTLEINASNQTIHTMLRKNSFGSMSYPRTF